MARVPDVARLRFFSGMLFDTLNFFCCCFSESVGPNCPHKAFTFVELIDQKQKKERYSRP